MTNKGRAVGSNLTGLFSTSLTTPPSPIPIPRIGYRCICSLLCVSLPIRMRLAYCLHVGWWRFLEEAQVQRPETVLRVRHHGGGWTLPRFCWGEGVLIVIHDRSLETVEPRIPTLLGRSTEEGGRRFSVSLLLRVQGRRVGVHLVISSLQATRKLCGRSS